MLKKRKIPQNIRRIDELNTAIVLSDINTIRELLINKVHFQNRDNQPRALQ